MVLFCADGGQKFYGIQPECPGAGQATVRGILCNQDKRDQFRLSVSTLICQQLTPPIVSTTITTHFWPVIDQVSREPIDDLFVVGMQVAYRSTSVNLMPVLTIVLYIVLTAKYSFSSLTLLMGIQPAVAPKLPG